jgi:hypothetical protein
MVFKTSLGTAYNQPPSLSRQHSYTLLNRHPHQLNTNDEKGYQFETIYTGINDWNILLNHSRTRSHAGQTLFEEYYGQISYTAGNRWQIEGALGYNSDISTKNITPILMTEFNWSGINTIHFEFQHQHVSNLFDFSEYDDQMLVLEYSRSPAVIMAIVAEYSNQYLLKNSLQDQKYWIYGQLTWSFLKGQQVSVLYGSRQAGFVCVGGVCRIEPEFDGFEIRLFSRF